MEEKEEEEKDEEEDLSGRRVKLLDVKILL